MSVIDYDGPGTLTIVDINTARLMPKDGFDRVITVCQESIEDNVSSKMTYNHYCMADGETTKYGGSSSYELFERAANTLYNALASDEDVLIHCHRGRSRSVAVSIAALGRLLDIGRLTALELIHYYHPTSEPPDRLLMRHARTYIDRYTTEGAVRPNGDSHARSEQ